jgi:hypothetical protein
VPPSLALTLLVLAISLRVDLSGLGAKTLQFGPLVLAELRVLVLAELRVLVLAGLRVLILAELRVLDARGRLAFDG